MRTEESYRDDTAGIYLRPITYDDTDYIIRWRNSEEVRKNFIYQEPFTKEGHECWLRTRVEIGEAAQMMICDGEDGTPVGSVYIRDIDRRHGKAEYGIFIGEEAARGRGLGTAAARLMLRYCFEEEGLNRVYLRALAGNARAVRSYEKAGFKREGYLRQDVRLGGEYVDVIWMAALAREWNRAWGGAGDGGRAADERE